LLESHGPGRDGQRSREKKRASSLQLYRLDNGSGYVFAKKEKESPLDEGKCGHPHLKGSKRERRSVTRKKKEI